MLRLAQQKEREGAGIPGGCARRRQRAGRGREKWRRRSPNRRRQGGESSREGEGENPRLKRRVREKGNVIGGDW